MIRTDLIRIRFCLQSAHIIYPNFPGKTFKRNAINRTACYNGIRASRTIAGINKCGLATAIGWTGAGTGLA